MGNSKHFLCILQCFWMGFNQMLVSIDEFWCVHRDSRLQSAFKVSILFFSIFIKLFDDAFQHCFTLKAEVILGF